jgi:hypothetical protein
MSEECQATPSSMHKTNFRAEPAYHRGGVGRFTRITSPCEFYFTSNNPPILSINVSAPYNGWIVIGLILTIVVIIFMISQITESPVARSAPGILILYWIRFATRQQNIKIDISNARKIVFDETKKEIGVLTTIHKKETWIAVKCPTNYEAVINNLKTSNDLKDKKMKLEDGKLKTSQIGKIIILIFFLALFLWVLIDLIFGKNP